MPVSTAHHREYMKEYYDRNKHKNKYDKSDKQLKIDGYHIKCDCGRLISPKSSKAHLKTKIHKLLMEDKHIPKELYKGEYEYQLFKIIHML